MPPVHGLTWLLALVLATAALPVLAGVPRLVVIAPERDHLAWTSARLLVQAAHADDLPLLLDGTAHDADAAQLILMPVRSLATRVPALEILELPFFYPDLNAVHRAVDGRLGDALREAAVAKGWRILAFWDEGMQVMSGLRRYDRAVNLTGMEFLLTRPDPVAQRQFLAWHATPRRIAAESRDAVLRECKVASRAATLQEIQREDLARAHLSLSLTEHRYEGWLLLASSEGWNRLSQAQRVTLLRILPGVTVRQRAEAASRERSALRELRQAGLTVYPLSANQRRAFVERLPPWSALLDDDLDPQQRARLLGLACVSEDSTDPSPCARRAQAANSPVFDPSPKLPATAALPRSPE